MRAPRLLALLLAVLLAAAALPLSGCSGTNRLGEVDLRGRTVAVVAAIPPHPRVQAGDPAEAAVDPYDPVGSAIRVGTAAAKYREARRAQARLDSAVALVDVADRIARSVLLDSAELLGFAPVGRPADADYLLDLRIYDYSLVADSFEGATFFALEGDVLLLDPATGRTLWERGVKEREVLDAALFGLPAIAGNVVTARALSQLTEAEMADGLERLADYVASRVVDRLRTDYLRTRDDYEGSPTG
ncbi:MAG: hypothetical protein R3181_13115 [Rubricoccaceae bacterium]|nr:hypothetical protein [Rubricoccaceae bacterium]